jgi:hypothetical protein
MSKTRQRARKHTGHNEQDIRCHHCGQQIPQSPGSEDEGENEGEEEEDKEVGTQPTKKTKVAVSVPVNEEDHAARAQFIYEKNIANAKLKILKEEQEVQAATAEMKEAEYEVEACNNKVKQFELDRTIQNLDRRAIRETWSNETKQIDDLSTVKELDNVRLKIFEAQHEVFAANLQVREAELGVQVAKNNLRQIELAKTISDLKRKAKGA